MTTDATDLRGQLPRIAIIEDHPDIREELQFYLEAKGYATWCVPSAEAFWRELHGRPVDIVLGKYLGLVALLGLATAAMTAASAAWVLALGGALTVSFFQAALLVYLKLMVVTALSVLLSAVASPILGAIIVFCAYVFGHATGVFLDLPPQFDGTFAKTALEAVYYIVPNLDNFNIQSEAANGMPVSWAYTAWAAGYGAAWTGVLLILACLAFEDKDL